MSRSILESAPHQIPLRQLFMGWDGLARTQRHGKLDCSRHVLTRSLIDCFQAGSRAGSAAAPASLPRSVMQQMNTHSHKSLRERLEQQTHLRRLYGLILQYVFFSGRDQQAIVIESGGRAGIR